MGFYDKSGLHLICCIAFKCFRLAVGQNPWLQKGTGPARLNWQIGWIVGSGPAAKLWSTLASDCLLKAVPHWFPQNCFQVQAFAQCGVKWSESNDHTLHICSAFWACRALHMSSLHMNLATSFEFHYPYIPVGELMLSGRGSLEATKGVRGRDGIPARDSWFTGESHGILTALRSQSSKCSWDILHLDSQGLTVSQGALPWVMQT